MGVKCATLKGGLWCDLMVRVKKCSFEFQNTLDFLCFPWGLRVIGVIDLWTNSKSLQSSLVIIPVQWMSVFISEEIGWNSPGWKIQKSSNIYATVRAILF